MDKDSLFSRRAAARALGVSLPVLDKLTSRHNLVVRQIPGHSRRYYVRSEIMRLLSAAETGETLRAESRA